MWWIIYGTLNYRGYHTGRVISWKNINQMSLPCLIAATATTTFIGFILHIKESPNSPWSISTYLLSLHHHAHYTSRTGSRSPPQMPWACLAQHSSHQPHVDKPKLITIKLSVSQLHSSQVPHNHIWLVATTLDSSDTEHFCHRVFRWIVCSRSFPS